MPRFVLLRHHCPAGSHKASHWDFMLEWGGVLRTWELQVLPNPWRIALRDVMPTSVGSTSTEPVAKVVDACRLTDHRLAYLDYQGPLSRNRGSVSRCDVGTYTLASETSDRLEIALAGNRLQGRARLEPDKVRQDHWRLWVGES